MRETGLHSGNNQNSPDMSAIYSMMRRPMVCICKQVSREELEAAIEQGVHTLSGLIARTGCCTGCGTCRNSVLGVLEETQAGI